MKKLHILTLFLVAVLMVATSSKCTPAQTTSSLVADTVDTVATALTFDSVAYSYATADSTLTCEIMVHAPQGDDSLSVSIMNFLCEELANVSVRNVIDDGGNANDVYRGDISNAKAMVDFYGKTAVGCLREMLSELDDGTSREEYQIYLRYDAKVTLEDETDKYLTFKSNVYSYTGGAHGSAFLYGTNIVKATGKPLRETVDTTKVSALQSVLKKGICSYFKQFDNDVTEQNVHTRLFVEDGFIPLPACAPYLAKDGVHFVYGQYEIGPYAVGIIEFVVDYDTIRPYLTKEALQLIE